MMSKRILMFVLFFSLGLCGETKAEDALDLRVSPENIEIGTLYDGGRLTLSGTAPQGGEIIARLIGARRDLHMKQKGKVLGLLWMNKTTVEFNGVPSLYLVNSSKPLKELGAAGRKFSAEALLAAVKINPTPDNHAEMIEELIDLKRSEGLYQEQAAGITFTVLDAHNARNFTASLELPSRLQPGTYTLEVVAVRNGEITASSRRQMDARLVGAPRFMADLAFDYGALYGILATIIALFSGIGVGVVFQGRGGAH